MMMMMMMMMMMITVTLYAWHICWLYDCAQMQIRGSVHPVHPTSVIRMPPVIRPHLMCAHVIRPAATGVHAIEDTSEMDSPAQVSWLTCTGELLPAITENIGRIALYADAAYCYRPSSVVCQTVGRCVTAISPVKTVKPTEMSFRLRTRVGPRLKEPCIRLGPDPPMGRGEFKRKKGRPVVKCSDSLPWAVQKRLNRSTCGLGFGLGWAQGSMC